MKVKKERKKEKKQMDTTGCNLTLDYTSTGCPINIETNFKGS